MSSIKISDLEPVGFGLFSDSESYMRELSDAELALQGGGVRTDLSWLGSYVWDAVKTFVDPENRSEISRALDDLL